MPRSHAGTLRTDTATHVYPASDESVRQARRFVTTTLSSWGMSAAAEPAALITSELAANAARQGAGTSPAEILVRVSRSGRTAVIEVGDHDPAVPPGSPRMPATDAEHGRGLPLAAAAARRVACHQDGDWKIVRAEIRPLRPARAHGHLPWPVRGAA